MTVNYFLLIIFFFFVLFFLFSFGFASILRWFGELILIFRSPSNNNSSKGMSRSMHRKVQRMLNRDF